MEKIKKRIINSTLAATLVLSSAGAVLPGIASAATGIASGATSSSTMDSSLQLIVNDLVGVHTALSTNGSLSTVQTTESAIRSASDATWDSIIYGNSAAPNQQVVNLVKNLLTLSYSSSLNNTADLDAAVDQVLSNAQALDPNVTGTDIYNFYESFKSSLKSQVLNSIFSGDTNVSFTSMVDQALMDATNNTTKFQGILTNNGLHVSDLPTIRQNASNQFDPQNAALNALVTAYASLNLVPQSNVSLYSGNTATYNLKLASTPDVPTSIQGTTIPSSLITWSSSNPTVASFTAANTLTAGSVTTSSTSTITAKIHGYPVQVFTVTVSPYSGGGGGGGGGSTTTTQPTTPPSTPGVQGTSVDLSQKATVSSTTNTNGQKVTTATLDAAAVSAALTDNSIKQFTVNVADPTAAVIQAAIPAAAALQVAANNAQSSFTVQSSLGALNVPASVLSSINANSIASALGLTASQVDLSKATINITVTKAPDNVANAVTTTATQLQSQVLVPAVDFSIQVSLNGKSTELNNFGNTYVSRSFNLPANTNADANHIVGARVVSTTQPDGTVTAAFYPVPTVISNGVVTLKRPGDSTYTVIQTNKSFSDIGSNWAQSTITTLANKLVLSGYTDGTFRPDANITRAELATALVRALGLNSDPTTSSYSDIQSTDWENSYVAAAAKAGIVNGYPDGTFAPNKLVSRQEAATMIANAANFLKLQGTNTGKTFTDQSAIAAWANSSVDAVSKLGIINGYPDGSFQPNSNANRAEVSQMVLTLMKQANLTN